MAGLDGIGDIDLIGGPQTVAIGNKRRVTAGHLRTPLAFGKDGVIDDARFIGAVVYVPYAVDR